MQGDNARIMVVDDEEDIVRIIQKALQKYGLQVEAYSDPRKALDSFASTPASYVLIITDIRMPGMTGLELSERIWSIKPTAKILFMTAYLAEEMNVRARTIYKQDIIEKPFTIQKICDQVKMRLPESN